MFIATRDSLPGLVQDKTIDVCKQVIVATVDVDDDDMTYGVTDDVDA